MSSLYKRKHEVMLSFYYYFCTEHSTSHLWGASSGRRGWSRKRTSAPQMGNTQGSMPRIGLVLRSRRSWPVAPQSYRRSAEIYLSSYLNIF